MRPTDGLFIQWEKPNFAYSPCLLDIATPKDPHLSNAWPLTNRSVPNILAQHSGEMDLILHVCPIERRPHMQFYMAHRFRLQLLRRFSVKFSKMRNFTFGTPWLGKLKNTGRRQTTILRICFRWLYHCTTVTCDTNAIFWKDIQIFRHITRMDKNVQYLQNDRRSSSIPSSFSLYFLHRDIRKRYWALTVNRYLPTSSTSSLFCGNFFLFQAI